MKNIIRSILVAVFFCSIGNAQLITMSNKCYNLIKDGNDQLKAQQYDQALQTFNTVLSKCKAKDAKEQGNVGKAQALNGLKQYADAIIASDAALKAGKGINVTAFYSKGVALQALTRTDEAKACFDKVIELTEKNKNVLERATIYSTLANLEWKQNNLPNAYDYLNKAMKLDASNTSFYVLKGDMEASEKKYESAFTDYNQAINLGKNDVEIYQTIATKRLDQYQEKYHTTNGNELGRKLNPNEKKQLCSDIKKATDMGWKNMNMDMITLWLCK